MEETGPAAQASHEKARAMMHDARYHAAKAAIMKPISEFYGLMERRTNDAVQEAQTTATMLRIDCHSPGGRSGALAACAPTRF
jgi:hypothetical protein